MEVRLSPYLRRDLKKAAGLLQLQPSTLNEMMKRLGIHAKSNATVEDEIAVGE